MVLTTAKSKKSLVFIELICSLPSTSLPTSADDQLRDETFFLVSTLDPWYGDIIMYLQKSTLWSALTKDDCRCIRHQSQPYRIIDDTLYRVDVDYVLPICLTLEEVERVLNEYHSSHVVVVEESRVLKNYRDSSYMIKNCEVFYNLS